MNKPKMLSEIISEVESSKHNKHKVEILKAHDSVALRSILNVALNPNVRMLLPEGAPPYKVNEFDERLRLYSEYKKLHYLVAGGSGDQIHPMKREQIFIDLLESVPKEEAALLLRMKDRDIRIKPEIVREAFPGLL
jgi:hypothetical protein